MKITEKQIAELYKFTRQHFVEHYDVQTELVDHLANDIEHIWLENPELTFKEARDLSFKKFGVFGFMTVVDTKRVQLNKKYMKTIWRFTKEWFQLPKIIATFMLFQIFYHAMSLSFSEEILISVFLTIMLIEIVFVIKRKKTLNRQFKSTGKKWMFQDIINAQGQGNVVFIMFHVYFYLTPDNFQDITFYTQLFASFLLTATIIVGYVTLVVIPKKAEELLQETYPEYKML